MAFTVAKSSSLYSAQCDQGSGDVPTFMDTTRLLFFALRAPARAMAAVPTATAARPESVEAAEKAGVEGTVAPGVSSRTAPRRAAWGSAGGCAAATKAGEAKATPSMLPEESVPRKGCCRAQETRKNA